VKKKPSYELYKKFLNNYTWEEGQVDPVTAEKLADDLEFLQFAINTEPMAIVRRHAEQQGWITEGITDQDWIAKLQSTWFGQYYGNSTCALAPLNTCLLVNKAVLGSASLTVITSGITTI
jgi:hypothetical protein